MEVAFTSIKERPQIVFLLGKNSLQFVYLTDNRWSW